MLRRLLRLYALRGHYVPLTSAAWLVRDCREVRPLLRGSAAQIRVKAAASAVVKSVQPFGADASVKPYSFWPGQRARAVSTSPTGCVCNIACGRAKQGRAGATQVPRSTGSGLERHARFPSSAPRRGASGGTLLTDMRGVMARAEAGRRRESTRWSRPST